jgi:hypothetical protein
MPADIQTLILMLSKAAPSAHQDEKTTPFVTIRPVAAVPPLEAGLALQPGRFCAAEWLPVHESVCEQKPGVFQVLFTGR